EMKSHKAPVFLVLAVMALGAGFAEGPGKIQGYFDSKSISVGYAVFGGLTLAQGGQSSWTSAGISAHFEKLLSTYPDSSFALEEFRNKNTTGNILFWGGIAIEIAAPFLTLLASGDASNPAYGSYASIASLASLGGLVATTIGFFLLPMANQDLLGSVNAYNRGILADLDLELGQEASSP
ncbi:MAG: hypothetical protein ACOYM2_14245, partial [Rectinemataceae bacterium]